MEPAVCGLPQTNKKIEDGRRRRRSADPTSARYNGGYGNDGGDETTTGDSDG